MSCFSLVQIGVVIVLAVSAVAGGAQAQSALSDTSSGYVIQLDNRYTADSGTATSLDELGIGSRAAQVGEQFEKIKAKFGTTPQKREEIDEAYHAALALDTQAAVTWTTPPSVSLSEGGAVPSNNDKKMHFVIPNKGLKISTRSSDLPQDWQSTIGQWQSSNNWMSVYGEAVRQGWAVALTQNQSDISQWQEAPPIVIEAPNNGIKRSEDKTIYGADDRREVYEINFLQAQRFALGIASISKIGEATVMARGFCTAFLISKDEIMTAGHCINREDYQGKAIRFGDYVSAPGALGSIDAYTVESVDVWDYSHDLSIAKLKPGPDGKDAGEKYPVLQLSGRHRVKGTSVYMIGFPGHDYEKYAPNCTVIKESFFSEQYGKYIVGVDCDAFGGNSGSPIFDATTHEVIGMLWGGQSDSHIYDHATESIFEFAVPLEEVAKADHFNLGSWPTTAPIKLSAWMPDNSMKFVSQADYR